MPKSKRSQRSSEWQGSILVEASEKGGPTVLWSTKGKNNFSKLDLQVGGAWAWGHETVWMREPCLGNSEPTSEALFVTPTQRWLPLRYHQLLLSNKDPRAQSLEQPPLFRCSQFCILHWTREHGFSLLHISSWFHQDGKTQEGLTYPSSGTSARMTANGLAAKCPSPSLHGLSYSRASFSPRTHILKEAGPGFLTWNQESKSKRYNALYGQGPELAQDHFYQITRSYLSKQDTGSIQIQGRRGWCRVWIQGSIIRWTYTTNTK